MKITAIEPQARNPERVNIYVDGEFRLALAADIAFGAHLRTGDPVGPALLDELEERDRQWRAREAAFHLLSFRPRTQAELRRRLREKSFTEEAIERCLAELEERGLIDDASFAESFVRDRLRFRPRGPQRLLQELRTKGVDWETARHTVEEVWQQEEISELALARQAAAKWAPRQGENLLRARRRLYNFLARRGFSTDAVHTVVAERLP